MLPRSRNRPRERSPENGGGRSIDLPPSRVRPGESEVLVTIAPPHGHAFNTSAPFELHAKASGAGVTLDPESLHFVSSAPRFPHVIPARFRRGAGRIDLDVVAYSCEETEERLCFYQHVRLRVPVEVDERADEKRVSVTHRLGIPEDPAT